MPRKILADLGGLPMLAQMHRRLQASKEAFAVVVAAPIHDVKVIEAACPGIPIYGGPEVDLLTRLVGCAEEYEAYTLVRVTADCPLVCPEMIDYGIRQLDKVWHRRGKDKTPLVQNWRPRTYPDGFDFDIWSVDFLQELSDVMPAPKREYFAQYCLDENLNNSSIQNEQDLSKYRVTVDYPEDLELVRLIHDEMGDENWGAELIVRWLADHPEARKINEHRIDGKYGAKP